MQRHEITLHSEQGWLDSRAENKFWMKFNAFYKLCRRDHFYCPRLQLSFIKTSNNAAFLNRLGSKLIFCPAVVSARDPTRDSSTFAFPFEESASSRALIGRNAYSMLSWQALWSATVVIQPFWQLAAMTSSPWRQPGLWRFSRVPVIQHYPMPSPWRLAVSRNQETRQFWT